MIDTPPGPPLGPSQPPPASPQPTSYAQWTFLAWVLVVEVALVACLLVWRLSPAKTANVASAALEWEYLVQGDSTLVQTGGLTQRGQEKWELVTLKGEPAPTYYFKRPKSPQNPQTARVVHIKNRWSGRIDANLAKQPCPAVKGPKSLAALWKTFKQPGEPPLVDFSKDLAFAATTPGSHIDIVPVLYHGGALGITLTFGVTQAEPQDGAFVIVVVAREFSDNDGPHVIQSVGGSPVTAPGPED